jgi:hypothetical protein
MLFFFNFLQMILSSSVLSVMVEATKQMILWVRLALPRCFRARAAV